MRSAGADGIADDEPYNAGGFPPAETDRDIVWFDGFFLTWPAASPQP